MKFFVTADQIENEYIYINNSDVNHIKNVLRKNKGDRITIVCEKINYLTEIEDLTSEYIKCKILEKKEQQESKIKLTIFQGLTKADKIEYIIQKCTELGVYEIAPVEMKRCVVKLDEKDKNKKIDRWKKIAEVAAKQSMRNDILRIEKVLDFEELCNRLKEFDISILAYEKEEDITLKQILKSECKDVNSIAVVIGPEGGIDNEEYTKLTELGAKSVTLGSRILRTETAPVAIAAIIGYELEL